jgi:nucleoside recognition membrane protein YjiH
MRANIIMIIMGLLFLVDLVSANRTTGTTVVGAAQQFRTFLCQVLPIVIMIAFVFGAIAYAISQVLPGDQRARVQQVGAVSIVTGIIAAIIYVMGPELIGLIASNLSNVRCQ